MVDILWDILFYDELMVHRLKTSDVLDFLNDQISIDDLWIRPHAEEIKADAFVKLYGN